MSLRKIRRSFRFSGGYLLLMVFSIFRKGRGFSFFDLDVVGFVFCGWYTICAETVSGSRVFCYFGSELRGGEI